MPTHYPNERPISRPGSLPHGALAPDRFLPTLLWLEQAWSSDEHVLRSELRACDEGFSDWLLALVQGLGDALEAGWTVQGAILKEFRFSALADLVAERVERDLKGLLLQLFVAWLWAERCTADVGEGMMRRQRTLGHYKSELALRNQLQRASSAREVLRTRTKRPELWHLLDAPPITLVYASPEREAAERLAQELAAEEQAMRVELLAADNVRVLDALLVRRRTTSGTCLLLWSATSAGRWTEAAVWRDAPWRRRRSILLARLDAEPLPAGLGERDAISLYPEASPAVGALRARWRGDRVAEAVTGRRVESSVLEGETQGATIYASSDFLGRTVRLVTRLDVPSGLCLDRILDEVQPPSRVEFGERALMLFDYALFREGRRLDRAVTLEAQDVRAGDTLRLGCACKMLPESYVELVDGFRLTSGNSLAAQQRIDEQAWRALRRHEIRALSEERG